MKIETERGCEAYGLFLLLLLSRRDAGIKSTRLQHISSLMFCCFLYVYVCTYIQRIQRAHKSKEMKCYSHTPNHSLHAFVNSYAHRNDHVTPPPSATRTHTHTPACYMLLIIRFVAFSCFASFHIPVPFTHLTSFIFYTSAVTSYHRTHMCSFVCQYFYFLRTLLDPCMNGTAHTSHP